MKSKDINIRDPFVLCENGKYYLYGTRAKDFGKGVGGFDVYISEDLTDWSEPVECFNSIAYGMNCGVNWAPEVHKYKGNYYMFATFTRENGRRGTYILRGQSPLGPFEPHSKDAVTPEQWECLDGTLYTSKEGIPYLVFCHEHEQIIDGTICYVELSEDLTCSKGEVTTMFCASSSGCADKLPNSSHYVTDGPFLFRTKENKLLMLWSTFIKGQYAECVVRFKNHDLGMEFEHLEPLISDDGGHGMIFKKDDTWILTYHTPNTSGEEHPVFHELNDIGDGVELSNRYID